MKIALEQKDDSVINSKVYVLKIGKSDYLYERLEDALHRIVKVFEPTPIAKERKLKRESKFFMSKAILDLMMKTPKTPLNLDTIIAKTKSPRVFKKSIWATVLSKMVKSGILEVKQEGEGRFLTKWYNLAKER